MSKKHTSGRKRPPRPDARSKTGDSPAERKKPEVGGLFSAESIRETVESIVIAFILAFLFRTFEAEAFVIPTGSMAPTLLGRHKDLECPQCGYFFQTSASQEVDSVTNERTNNETIGGTCPMCRYTINGAAGSKEKTSSSYSGDRILVEKFPYQFRDPERWEVSVFKFPGGARTNYIKRICGLPNETIRISHGNLYVRPKGETEFTIARKPPRKLLAMMQPVYDNDYVLPNLIEMGWPQRWVNEDASPLGSASAWETSDYKRFRIAGQPPGEAWLRYQHVPPTLADWRYLAEGLMPPTPPERQLISDFTAYNTKIESLRPDLLLPMSGRGVHWVGDLVLECRLDIKSDRGELVFELVKGGRRFQCRCDVATGEASLLIDGDPGFGSPKARTSLKGPGEHSLRFANVDDELRLWIDGRPVEFDFAAVYPPLGNYTPTEADLLPAGIASKGAELEVSGLRLFRDLYYIADQRAAPGEPMSDFPRFPHPNHNRMTLGAFSPANVDEVFHDPRNWDFFTDYQTLEFDLSEGEFLALGDNSGESRDSRLWEAEGIGPCVKRELLIGKALFIYWPRSDSRIPGTNIPFPFFPNLKRMHVIR
ncbi:MAG: S26 family signal peptidase [Thermoguttaceae bacterium]|jgi:signal peptidase I